MYGKNFNVEKCVISDKALPLSPLPSLLSLSLLHLFHSFSHPPSLLPPSRLSLAQAMNIKDGSLRVIRSGIGINEAASIDLAGVKGDMTIPTGVSHCNIPYLFTIHVLFTMDFTSTQWVG